MAPSKQVLSGKFDLARFFCFNYDYMNQLVVENDNQISADLISQMIQAGVLIGHQKSKTNPKLKRIVAFRRQNFNFLDAVFVYNSLTKAAKFLAPLIKTSGKVLLVGTTPPAKESVKKLAAEFDQPYIINRWLGGTLTNFGTIRKSVNFYVDLKAKKEEGGLEKYTKKERLMLSRLLSKMAKKFDGLVKMEQLPEAVIIVDIQNHLAAVKEANHLGIPIVGVLDDNDSVNLVQYPIFANDRSATSIEWIFDQLKSKINES